MADVSDYQKARISKFASVCDEHLGKYDFIDCGAHLGLFSAQFTRCSDRVQKLTAVEPNSFLFSLLNRNRRNIRASQVECVNAALADFEGRGRLVKAAYDAGLDAMYLEESLDGNIEVTTLSKILRGSAEPRAAIKVDVEGLEVPVLCGATDAIRSLDRVVVFVELHKAVLERTGMSDVEMVAHIEGIRPFMWINSDDGAPIDSRIGILKQLNLPQQCDLIGIG
jgi:FkbM family methyltransferase